MTADPVDGARPVRVVVDLALCEGNALCMGIAPEVFDVGEHDKVVVLDETPPETMRTELREAVRSCPRQAITLVEDPART